MIWTIYSVNTLKSLTFISIFYIEKHYFILSATKVKYKIPVETHTTLSDYVSTEIFSSKVPHFIINFSFRLKVMANSKLPLIWDHSFALF